MRENSSIEIVRVLTPRGMAGCSREKLAGLEILKLFMALEIC